jgi:hypothetical protein
LYFDVRRAQGAAMTEARFDALLQGRLARGALVGLLRDREAPLERGTAADAPNAVLLVDRPAMRRVLAAAPAIREVGLAVVDVRGDPAALVARLTRLVRDGLIVPVLYIHDAATVVYPFAVEPLAALVRQASRPIAYRDLGLPPLGAAARRFGDPRLPPDEPVVILEAVPPGTLARYCARSAAWLAPAAPLTAPRAIRRAP